MLIFQSCTFHPFLSPNIIDIVVFSHIMENQMVTLQVHNFCIEIHPLLEESHQLQHCHLAHSWQYHFVLIPKIVHTIVPSHLMEDQILILEVHHYCHQNHSLLEKSLQFQHCCLVYLWKYHHPLYLLILVHVGFLYQSLVLVLVRFDHLHQYENSCGKLQFCHMLFLKDCKHL